jgi:hypothetical protein
MVDPASEPFLFDTSAESWLARVGYLGASAVVAAELMAAVPDPPTPPRRSHKLAESRQQRLSRWRVDHSLIR